MDCSCSFSVTFCFFPVTFRFFEAIFRLLFGSFRFLVVVFGCFRYIVTLQKIDIRVTPKPNSRLGIRKNRFYSAFQRPYTVSKGSILFFFWTSMYLHVFLLWICPRGLDIRSRGALSWQFSRSSLWHSGLHRSQDWLILRNFNDKWVHTDIRQMQ